MSVRYCSHEQEITAENGGDDLTLDLLSHKVEICGVLNHKMALQSG